MRKYQRTKVTDNSMITEVKMKKITMKETEPYNY